MSPVFSWQRINAHCNYKCSLILDQAEELPVKLQLILHRIAYLFRIRMFDYIVFIIYNNRKLIR